MWIIIIIAVIVIILYKFSNDKNKLYNQINAEGGIRTKYKVIVSALLSEPDAEIIVDKIETLMIAYRTIDATTYFAINPIFTDVNINWSFDISNVETGTKDTLNKSWKFPNHMNQNSMLEIMLQDIQTITLQYFTKRGLNVDYRNDYQETVSEIDPFEEIMAEDASNLLLKKAAYAKLAKAADEISADDKW